MTQLSSRLDAEDEGDGGILVANEAAWTGLVGWCWSYETAAGEPMTRDTFSETRVSKAQTCLEVRGLFPSQVCRNEARR